MWRRIQAGIGRICDSFHGPVQHFANAAPLPKASNNLSSSDETERPGTRLRPQARPPAPGSTALNRDKKAARVNKRRHRQSRSAPHCDYVLKLERLVFGLDQIEDDESLSNAIDCRIENALDDAKCEDHGVYERRVEELVDEKWKTEERIQKGFVKLSANAIAVHNTFHAEREESSNSILPLDFREALEDWSMKRKVCQERQSMCSRKEDLRDVGQRLLQAKTAQIKRKGWRPTSSYLGKLQHSRNKILRLAAVSKVARRNEQKALRRLCKVHARKALFDVSNEGQRPPTEHQKAADIVPDNTVVPDVVQAPDLKARWYKVTEEMRAILSNYYKRTELGAYDRALKGAKANTTEPVDIETFNKQWFEEIATLAKDVDDSTRKFAAIRDEAMRAGFEPIVGDEMLGEFLVHRDDGNTELEAVDKRLERAALAANNSPNTDVLNFVKAQKKIMLSGWMDVGAPAKQPDVDTMELEEVGFGDSRTIAWYGKTGPDSAFIRSKIRDWGQQREATFKEATARYQELMSKLLMPSPNEVTADNAAIPNAFKRLDLEVRWNSIKRFCEIGGESLREVVHSRSARDKALEEAVNHRKEAFNMNTFQREWFAEVSKRARIWRNVGEKFVPIRDEAMRAGFSPVAIGDEAWQEFPIHRDDGNTSSEGKEERERRTKLAGEKRPYENVLKFVKEQERVMGNGGWKDADMRAHTRTPTAELSVRELEFGESQAGGLTDSQPVKDKILQWRQACEQTRIEADAIYQQASQPPTT